MFQNIVDKEQVETSSKTKMNVKEFFKIGDIAIYILSFMISMVSFSTGLAPFGIAMFAAICSNRVPAGFAYIAILAGTFIGFGLNGMLTFLLTSILLVALIILFKPIIYDTERNEKQKLRSICFYCYYLSTSHIFNQKWIFAI